MRKEDKITVNGLQVTVKELTVAEVRHWMMDIKQQVNFKETEDNGDFIIDVGLFEDIQLSDFCRMTDLEKKQLDDFTPSELKLIQAKCEELNPNFFGLTAKIRKFASQSPSAG